MWLNRHWRGLLGLASFGPPLARSTLGILGLAGDADFVITHWSEPGWLVTMASFLLNPPNWSVLPLILVGLGFLAWDYKRTLSRRGGAKSEPDTARHQESSPVPSRIAESNPCITYNVTTTNNNVYITINEAPSDSIGPAFIIWDNVGHNIIDAHGIVAIANIDRHRVRLFAMAQINSHAVTCQAVHPTPQNFSTSIEGKNSVEVYFPDGLPPFLHLRLKGLPLSVGESH